MRANQPAENFQQFTDAVEMFRFIDESKEYVVDLFADKSPQTEEFAVNPMQHRLEEVTLARIFTVE